MNQAMRIFVLCLMLMCSFSAVKAAAIYPGDESQAVADIQAQLAKLGYEVSVDGKFGLDTENAIKSFQQENGLDADGVIGSATYAALFDGAEMDVSLAQYVGLGTDYGLDWDSGQDADGIVDWNASQGGDYSFGQRLLEIAAQYQGYPYVWGGASPSGFDCSGFVKYVFACAGIDIPRTADTQFDVGDWVDKQDLQPGDLVFFSTYAPGASHVGIYWGDGQFIHASSAQGVVCFDSLYRDYRVATYIGAKRMF